VSPRTSPHTTESRDSIIPSVTNGAIIGSAACKKHELPRGSSAIMIVLPRNHREQHMNLPKLFSTDNRENGTNIPGPGSVSGVYAGRDGPFCATYQLDPAGTQHLAECPCWELPHVSGQSVHFPAPHRV
jgi:hypothetical protein